MTEHRQPVILDIDGPRDPLYVLEVAEAFAEASRVLNHLTLSHEALEYPSEVDTLIRYLASAAASHPQLLGQIGGWLEQEQAAGRIRVAGSENYPATAVAAARVRLDKAAAIAEELQEALDYAASVTCNLAAAEVREDGSDDH